MAPVYGTCNVRRDTLCYHSSAGLGEFKIRDLNDEINKLLREKGHWEVRIKELGGPDYGVSVNERRLTSDAFCRYHWL